jgi:3D (Asp-Asp-Asp) domain-containing protein
VRIFAALFFAARLFAAEAASPEQKKIPIQKRGSIHLAKGWVIVLAGPKNGRPMQVMLGHAQQQNPIWIPKVCKAWKSLKLEATAYDPGPEANGVSDVGATVTGQRARFGIAAVDPRRIPLKSLLYVEGYGPALAADIGGDIKGARLDLCFNSSSEARAFGRKKTRVWLLSGLKKAEADKVLEALKD